MLNVDLVKLVYFSPTGTSKKVAAAIAEGIHSKIEYVNLTPPAANTIEFGEFRDDIAIIAVPVYAGRCP